jgi:hypothetical protein
MLASRLMTSVRGFATSAARKGLAIIYLLRINEFEQQQKIKKKRISYRI